MRGPREGGGVGKGRTQLIALTSPCGGGIGMQRAGGPACCRIGGGQVVIRRVPSVPAGCPVRRLSSSGPSSLAGGVGVAGSRRWRSCPCTGCPVAGSGGGSVGAAAAGVDWSVGWAFVCCCQSRSACWLASVGVCGGVAPLFLPEEARHVPACVAGHDAGPSWCWVQAFVSYMSVVLSHKGDSVAVM